MSRRRAARAAADVPVWWQPAPPVSSWRALAALLRLRPALPPGRHAAGAAS